MTDYRHLPPVEPVDPPSRFSMTTLQRDDRCPRSSYLGTKHRDGPSSHAMDRGILFHAAAERLMADLMRSGEPRLSPDDPGAAAAMTAAIVDEVLRARPELVVPRAEVDDVREMMFHVATGYDVDPQTIGGLELLMVLDLECGWTVSGRLDLIALPSAEIGQVDDWKTSPAVPAQDEYEASLQPWIYAVLLCYGSPVRVTQCPDCDGEVVVGCVMCDDKGYTEQRGEPFGQHLRGVLMREVYPRPKLRDDGLLHHRQMLLARTAVADFKADLERQAARLGERFKTGDFPARSGSWCSICPAPQECPLPEQLRDYAGSINSVDQAQEAWERVLHVKAQVAAIEKEVKTFARAHDVPIRVGDLEWSWTTTEGRAVRKTGGRADWSGLVEAVREAADYGKPFNDAEWIVDTTGTTFKKTKIGETR